MTEIFCHSVLADPVSAESGFFSLRDIFVTGPGGQSIYNLRGVSGTLLISNDNVFAIRNVFEKVTIHSPR